MTGAPVARTGTGTTAGNTVAPRLLRIFFQRYPGTDAASGIANVPYVLRVGGTQQRGRTNAAGRVSLSLPQGATAELEIFGTTYRISARGALTASTRTKGRQQRLAMLGYWCGTDDGILGAKTERATLHFQADHAPLRVDGNGPAIRTRLRQVVHAAGGE